MKPAAPNTTQGWNLPDAVSSEDQSSVNTEKFSAIYSLTQNGTSNTMARLDAEYADSTDDDDDHVTATF